MHTYVSSSSSSRLNTPNRSLNPNNRFTRGECQKMESSGSETETPLLLPNKKPALRKKNKKKSNGPKILGESWPVRKRKVTLEGYINDVGSDQDSESGSSCGGVVGRTKTLTDEDLEELKGCLDLGFGFSYDEIPDLCSTLPALELCYSMSQMYFDDHHRSSDANSSDHDSVASLTSSTSSPLVANWKISSPGDHPDEVKARLRYWAQAVACTVRLCS